MKSNLSWFALFLNKIILTKMQIWVFWVVMCAWSGIMVSRSERVFHAIVTQSLRMEWLGHANKLQTPSLRSFCFALVECFFPSWPGSFDPVFFTLVYFILSCNWICIFHEKNATKKTHSTYSFKKASQKSTGTITQHSVTVSSMSRKACSVTSPNRDCGTIDVALFGLPINLRNALNNVKYKERNWANTVIILSFAQVTNPIYN